MENNNYKKYSNLRLGSLNIPEVTSIGFGTVSPAPGVTVSSVTFLVDGNNAVTGYIPCKVVVTPELLSYYNSQSTQSDGTRLGVITVPGNSSSPTPITFATTLSNGSELVLTVFDGGYILLPLNTAVINAQPNWNESSVKSPAYIRNKPSVEVTGNKATSFTTLNNTKYPTTQAVANYVASELQSHVPDVSGKEDKTNKVTSWSATPLDTNYPSEKLVYDTIGNVEALLAAL